LPIVDDAGMAGSDEKPTPDREAGEKLPPAQDLMRMLERYAADLQQIVERLRKRLQ
jgi:hypothetical protein